MSGGKNCSEFEFSRGFLLFECTLNEIKLNSEYNVDAKKVEKMFIWALTTNDMEIIGKIPLIEGIEEEGRTNLVYLRSFGVGNETQNLFVRPSKKVDGEDVLIFFRISNNGVVRNEEEEM